jgi:hypothetical protein
VTKSFARGTEVPTHKTRLDIEQELSAYGATAFSSGFDENKAFIVFRMNDRWVRLELKLPLDDELSMSATGRVRSQGARAAAAEAERRRLWRSLLLLVKAKLTAVSDGIVTFEEEFLPHIMTVTGQTVYSRIRDEVAIEYKTGAVRGLLPMPRP